jgi:hypothetical protein
LSFAGVKLPFWVRDLCTFQQRHYRQDNQLTRKIFSGSLEQCNPFPDISETLCSMLSFKCGEQFMATLYVGRTKAKAIWFWPWIVTENVLHTTRVSEI